MAGALRDLLRGRIDRAEFLLRFGHRGPNEMESASPCWAEDPDTLRPDSFENGTLIVQIPETNQAASRQRPTVDKDVGYSAGISGGPCWHRTSILSSPVHGGGPARRYRA